MKNVSWSKILVVMIIWMATVYLIVEGYFDSRYIGDFFVLGLYLLTALAATAAVWSGFSLDVHFRIGNMSSSDSPPSTHFFARGLALGAFAVMLVMLGILPATLSRLASTEQEYRNFQSALQPVVCARKDILPGQVITMDLVGKMTINRSALTPLYVEYRDIESLLGRTARAEISARMPILRNQLESASSGGGHGREEGRGGGVGVHEVAE
jgi:hypothetical protein